MPNLNARCRFSIVRCRLISRTLVLGISNYKIDTAIMENLLCRVGIGIDYDDYDYDNESDSDNGI